jgi:hypothetical protein
MLPKKDHLIILPTNGSWRLPDNVDWLDFVWCHCLCFHWEFTSHRLRMRSKTFTSLRSQKKWNEIWRRREKSTIKQWLNSNKETKKAILSSIPLPSSSHCSSQRVFLRICQSVLSMLTGPIPTRWTQTTTQYRKKWECSNLLQRYRKLAKKKKKKVNRNQKQNDIRRASESFARDRKGNSRTGQSSWRERISHRLCLYRLHWGHTTPRSYTYQQKKGHSE